MKTRRGWRWHIVWLMAILVAALAIRFRGIQWPNGLHPDEKTISDWMHYRGFHSTLHQVYPEGFFTLIRPVRAAAIRLSTLRNRWAYWRGAADSVDPPSVDSIALARNFNVWLGSLTCVFVCLLVRRITGSAGAGVFGAALLCFAPYHIEHCHYAETDITMVWVLITALWLWATTLDRHRPLLHAAAALVSGFAVGTKYNLAVLVLLPLAYGLARRDQPATLTSVPRRLAGAGAAAFLFLAGFLLANPSAIEIRNFVAGAAARAAVVYGEAEHIMGDAGTGMSARVEAHARFFARGAQSLGWGWLCLSLAGIPLLFARGRRRFWPVTILFPLLYAGYYFLQAPWVRGQEFLPFLPWFVLSATLPLVAAWQTGTGGLRAAARAAVLIAGFFSLLQVAVHGTAEASLFGWKDSRHLARAWLRRCSPAGRTVGVEIYTPPADKQTFGRAVNVYKIEFNGLSYALENDCDYVLRNADADGRGIFDPRTGRRFPRYRQRFDEFLANSEPLLTWAPMPPDRTRATFCNPAMELYGLHLFPAAPDLAVALPRPFALRTDGRETFFPVGHKLGSDSVLELTQFPRQLAFGGPAEPSGPVYVLLQTRERPARVRLNGFGRDLELDLEPYALRIVPLERPWWMPRFGKFEILTAATEPREHVVRVPCFLYVAFDAADVLRIASSVGCPEAVWTVLDEKEDFPWSADLYTAAVATGRWAAADRLRVRALDTLNALAARLDESPPRTRINGIPAFYLRDFSRLRFHGHDAVEALRTAPVAGAKNDSRSETGVLHPPVILPAGYYQMRIELAAADDGDPAPESLGTVQVRDRNGRVLAERELTGLHGDRFVPLTFPLTIRCPTVPAIHFATTRPVRFEYRNLEVSWDPADALRSVHERLLTALAAHSIRLGRHADALELLDRTGPDAWNDLEVRQLRFRACREADGDADVIGAARTLLALAPGHAEARAALTGGEPAGDGGRPVARFGGLLALRAADVDPQTGRVRCTFEALRNDTPPLSLSVRTLRRKRWRQVAVYPIGDGRPLMRGERVRVTVDLPERDGGGYDGFGLAVQSNVKWFPGTLPVEGRRDRVIPLAALP